MSERLAVKPTRALISVYDKTGIAAFARALELARASDEYQEVSINGRMRYRARFFPGEAPLKVRDLYELIAEVLDVEVLIDDRPLPYARELWLPLVWCLIK